ncbi:hypothetical protein ACFYE2_00475 [Kocuria sp. CPCC 205300]|uniref:hypothetical protein n=1 Tax=Kocuria sabuli TaxID=3071448 RepID=UPI0036DF5974
MKLQFAIDYEHKREPVKAGDTLDVDPLRARALIHEGIARPAPDKSSTAAKTNKKEA